MHPFSLSGRTALVTGSTQGIGQAFAAGLAAAGARVITHGLPDGKGADASASGGEGRAHHLAVDLLNEDAPPWLIKEAMAIAPDLDILVCNAGSLFDTAFLDMSPELWDRTLRLNVRAPYFLIQSFARRLVAEGRGGAVVVTASTNGFQAELDSSAYDISKGGVVMMIRTLAVALASHGIRVNGVAPGFIRTPLTERALHSVAGLEEFYERNIPLGRIGAPDDCAGAVVFLASDQARYITGHVLPVDGGMLVSQVSRF